MKLFKKLLANEEGVILVIALLIMALLIGAGAGAIFSTQTDLRTSSNLKIAEQAFFVADAGFEWAKQQLRNASGNPPAPTGVTNQAFSPGTFTVVFGTAVKVSNLIAEIPLTVTGTVGSSTVTIVGRIKKTYELSDGALSLRGDTDFGGTGGGSSWLVDGKDYALDGTVTSNKKQIGISVPDSSADTAVTGSIDSNQQTSVQGKGTTPDVEDSTLLPSSEMTQFATDLCDSANSPNTFTVPASGSSDATIASVGGGEQPIIAVASGWKDFFLRWLPFRARLAMAGNHNIPTLNVPTNQTWGTEASPKLVCITGQSGDATDKVDFGGNFNGAGILVIKDANMVINGSFNWKGLILITGNNVGLEIAGGGQNKNILGSIMVNETVTGGDSGKEVDLQGNANVQFSSAALKNAIDKLFTGTNPLANIYDTLPSNISVVYWKMN